MTEDPTLEKMEKFLESRLIKGEGRFCVENTTFPITNWGITMFRKFLKSKVQKGILKTDTDELGRVWYSRV